MGKGNLWKRFTLCMICILLLFCSSCADKRVYVTTFDQKYLFSLGNADVTVSEYNTILLEIQRQYEAYYQEILGDDIWNREIEEGISFAEYVKENIVLDEVITLQLLQMLAEELEITLTEEEQKTAGKAAADYMERAGEETVSYCGSSLELIQQLYEKYVIAEKVIAYYTEQANLEVSENEARAIRIQMFSIADAETAKKVSDALEAGDSFQEVSEDFGNEELKEYNVVRGELTEEIEEVVFSLAQGECSPVLETENGYCIIYCLSDYLADITEGNRQNIIRQRIYDAWFSEVRQMRQDLKLNINESEWKHIRMAENKDAESCFFQIYESYFGEAGLQNCKFGDIEG